MLREQGLLVPEKWPAFPPLAFFRCRRGQVVAKVFAWRRPLPPPAAAAELGDLERPEEAAYEPHFCC